MTKMALCSFDSQHTCTHTIGLNPPRHTTHTLGLLPPPPHLLLQQPPMAHVQSQDVQVPSAA